MHNTRCGARCMRTRWAVGSPRSPANQIATPQVRRTTAEAAREEWAGLDRTTQENRPPPHATDPDDSRMQVSSEFVSDAPISLATWDASSLFTSASFHHPRHTRKRLFLEQLFSDVDTAVLQECRGTPGDLSQLPPSHNYQGTFGPVDQAAGASRAGGLVFHVREVYQRATDRHLIIHQRGRVATLSLLLGQWVHISGFHLDPDCFLMSLLTWAAFKVSNFDWVTLRDFVAGGETRYDAEGKPTTSDHTMTAFFDDSFEGWTELFNLCLLFGAWRGRLAGRRSRAGSILFSRTRPPFLSLERHSVQV